MKNVCRFHVGLHIVNNFFMVGVSCLGIGSKENPFLLRAVTLSTPLVH